MSQPLVFIDIDNTLAARDTQTADERRLLAQCAPATPPVAEAIRRAAAAGTVLMLCTGRPRCGIVKQILDLPFRGMVCCSGAWAEVDGIAVHEEWLPEVLITQLLARIEEHRLPALFESNELVCVYEPRPEVPHQIACARSTEELAQLNGSMKFSKLIASNELAALLREDEELMARVTVFDAAGGANEITLPSINKQAGIDAILDAIGRDSFGTVYGIGDSENDAALFDAVDIRIAMGNAPESLKARADWVAPDVAHDGVVDALAHFGLDR